KVLYNDAYGNIFPSNGPAAQGGPSRFAKIFYDFFSGDKKIELIPIFFSNGNIGEKAHTKTGKYRKSQYAQILYDVKKVIILNNSKISRREYVNGISDIISAVKNFLSKNKPDVIFLNGFSINNWILLRVGHLLKIPIIIQHAGLWKMELRITEKFNPEIRKIFYSFEKDTIKWASHHIFLNEFSQNIFNKIYKSKETDLKIKNNSSIVPLPIEISNDSKFKLHQNSGVVRIGSVARWDGIKNHRAIYRLATSKYKPSNWSVEVVTNIPKTTINQEFKAQYKKSVKIVKPMDSGKLSGFYRKMDVIFLPSNFDVSPTVVAEAFMQSVPVIISDKVGWISEYEKCGLLCHTVETDSSGEKIVDIINRTLLNKKKKLSHYKKFVDYLKKQHNPNIVFNQYLKLFKKYSK
ncbi:MAG TPA: glycosyltransferase, partial [Candidatus Paceibacterota bacterium]|nr:glycosyltransferase [Candidatus Paceibacterota bacterium]